MYKEPFSAFFATQRNIDFASVPYALDFYIILMNRKPLLDKDHLNYK